MHAFHSNVSVADVNECIDETAECDDDTYCFNTPGSYSCEGL